MQIDDFSSSEGQLYSYSDSPKLPCISYTYYPTGCLLDLYDNSTQFPNEVTGSFRYTQYHLNIESINVESGKTNKVDTNIDYSADIKDNSLSFSSTIKNTGSLDLTFWLLQIVSYFSYPECFIDPRITYPPNCDNYYLKQTYDLLSNGGDALAFSFNVDFSGRTLIHISFSDSLGSVGSYLVPESDFDSQSGEYVVQLSSLMDEDDLDQVDFSSITQLNLEVLTEFQDSTGIEPAKTVEIFVEIGNLRIVDTTAKGNEDSSLSSSSKSSENSSKASINCLSFVLLLFLLI